MASCSVDNPKFFSKIESATDPTYGYTPENPITIKNSNLSRSIDASDYYISRLRSSKGNMFNLIGRISTINPNYQNKFSFIRNNYTGLPISYGTGPFLDVYLLKPKNESDTIRIYVNPYLRGSVKIPCGLKFEKELK